MGHSIPSNIELKHKYNRIIRVGKAKKFVTQEDKTLRISIDGNWLDKPIQVYRMWYRFLQLALELEEQGVYIITKMEKTKLKKPQKDKWGKLQQFEMRPIKQRVKVNRKKYQGWDLDIIPLVTFDDWWKGKAPKRAVARMSSTALAPVVKIEMSGISAHRELFYPEKSITVLEKPEEWVKDKSYTYFRIDNRRRINEIERDLRTYFVTERQKGKLPEYTSVSDFPIQGKPNVNTLINRYNSLILQLTSLQKDKEMLASNVFRPTKEGMGESDADEEGAYSYTGSPGRAMRDLILPAKIALLSVCDGYFVSNPNKDYF